MKINFINSTNYCDALRKVIDVINARKVDLNVRHLLIVPERYTLLAEKYLYENSEGSFDVEVLSLSRLFYKMNITTPLLSREGAIMLLRGMLPSVELKCFKRSASYRGFCEKLYDAINDFAGSGVLPRDIPSGTTKLDDLRTLYEKYLDGIEGRFVDSMGKLKLIALNASTSKYLNNVHIYVANFDYIDSATREVLDELKRRALSYTESSVEPVFSMPKRAYKFKGDGAPAVKEVAKRLRFYAYRGTKYEDMAVIAGNADLARIKRIFTEFGIPYFVDKDKNLIDHPLSSLIIHIFDCAKSHRRECFIKLSKNIYFRNSKEQSDLFEDYVCSHLIDYKGFNEPFEECEETRKKLVSVVNFAAERMRSTTDADSFGKLLNDIFGMMGVEKTTEEVFGTDAVTEKIEALINLMKQVDIKGNFDFIFAVFCEGLKSTKLASIPYDGGVIIGDPAAFRGGKYKFMAVIGFDDGFLPQIYDDGSLIGDEEKKCFANMQRAEEINARYEAELAACLMSADSVFATYTEPSGMMDELFCNAEVVTGNDSGDLLLDAGSKKHALELLTVLYNRSKTGKDSIGENSLKINSLYKAAEASEELFYSKRLNFVQNADKLFFPTGFTSVSQLQTYFRCPFRHFADYGLRLKDRDRGEVTALDVGSFLHLIVERAVKGGDLSDVKRVVCDITDGIVKEGGKLSLPANADKLASLKKEAIEALGIYASHLAKGSFRPIGQEISFTTDLGGVKLYGKIDMADEVYGYIRLIDYKTGKADLTFSDVYYGKKIQLPIYMSAAAEKGYRKAAMFNFPFSYDWLRKPYDHRFLGFLLDDPDIIKATDNTLCEGSESEVFKLKLSGGKISKNSFLLSAEEMDRLVDYAVELCAKAIEEIKSGFVAASAIDGECEYCDYVCVCANKRVRKLATANKSSFEEV